MECVCVCACVCWNHVLFSGKQHHIFHHPNQKSTHHKQKLVYSSRNKMFSKHDSIRNCFPELVPLCFCLSIAALFFFDFLSITHRPTTFLVELAQTFGGLNPFQPSLSYFSRRICLHVFSQGSWNWSMAYIHIWNAIEKKSGSYLFQSPPFLVSMLKVRGVYICMYYFVLSIYMYKYHICYKL